MAGLSGEQDARRSILDTQAISSPTTQQEQAVGASSYPESQGSILSQQPSSGRNIWGLNTVGSPDTGFNYEGWANTLGRPALNYTLNSLAAPAGAAAGEAIVPIAGEGLSTAGLESGAGAYMAGAEAGLEGVATAATGEAAAEAGAEVAGAGASGYLALAYMLYKFWKTATQGTGRNDPMEQTRDIALGGRDLARLLQGYQFTPEDARFPRYNPEYSVESGTGVSVGNYGQENIPELYARLHQTSRGGYQGSHVGGFFGWGGSGEPTHITDQDVDNYLYSQGVTREQLSQAIGYEPPDWGTTNWNDFMSQRAIQVAQEREQRIANNQATDADIAFYSSNLIGQGGVEAMYEQNSPLYQDYWTALQARDPNLAPLPAQQAITISTDVLNS
jgi:hypothetical protein